ncbi:MAG: hypothetical protein ACYDA3_04420 [Gaiellaceae bacterium]
MRFATIVFLLALALVPVARADTGLIVGVDDDLAKWLRSPKAPLAVERDLGLRAVRFSVRWHSGESTLDANTRAELSRAIPAAYGLRVVLSVTGVAQDAPQDGAARDDFCSFVRNTLQRFPTVNDVAIWNEANTKAFWSPQKGAPAAYEALLARCWDILHAYRPAVNVIDSTAARSNPGDFLRGVGRALRASGRSEPVLDTVGHHPYPATNAELPTRKHKPGSIGEGDLDRLVAALHDAFGTVPPIWYLEDGYQSSVPAGLSGEYDGVESSRSVVDPATQADRLTAAVRLAYCQPHVAAFFNFELVDERDLAGWQSGILYADGTPKPAYAALKATIAQLDTGEVACKG